VTWRVDRDRPELEAAERDEVVRVLRHFSGQRYDLIAYVVMNNHVHVIVTPRPGIELERLVHSWKSFSAHHLALRSRRGRVWQSEYFDRVIRNDDELREKVEYVLSNPYRRWPELHGYPWVWAEGLDPDC
jgi:REP element-mobilizing transposase RayT